MPVDGGVQIPLVGDLDDDLRALLDLESRTRDGAVVAQHPHRGVAHPLGHRPDRQVQGVAGGQLQQLGPGRLRQPRRVGRERLVGQWVGLGVVVHGHPPGRPAAEASGNSYGSWVFEEPGSAEGPDQDPKPLVRVPNLPLLLFGVDWGTLPLSYRRSKRASREGGLTSNVALTSVLDTLVPSTSDTEGYCHAIGRRPGGPAGVRDGSRRAPWLPVHRTVERIGRSPALIQSDLLHPLFGTAGLTL